MRTQVGDFFLVPHEACLLTSPFAIIERPAKRPHLSYLHVGCLFQVWSHGVHDAYIVCLATWKDWWLQDNLTAYLVCWSMTGQMQKERCCKEPTRERRFWRGVLWAVILCYPFRFKQGCWRSQYNCCWELEQSFFKRHEWHGNPSAWVIHLC
jgi:hypothetical protein